MQRNVGYPKPDSRAFKPDRIGWMYLDGVTQSAGKRRKKRTLRYGASLTIALILSAVALLAFGHGALR